MTGNSLAEFAVTTAMMATLAATAAPQFGSVGEGAKEKKTMNNIDKIVQAANNYYNQKLDEEGRGRFPGQIKYDEPVGSAPTIDLNEDPTVAEGLATFVDVTLSTLDDFEDSGLDQFVYVFANSDNLDPEIKGSIASLSQYGVDPVIYVLPDKIKYLCLYIVPSNLFDRSFIIALNSVKLLDILPGLLRSRILIISSKLLVVFNTLFFEISRLPL